VVDPDDYGDLSVTPPFLTIVNGQDPVMTEHGVGHVMGTENVS